MAHTLPLATLTSDPDSIKHELRMHLPPLEVALHLAHAFFTNAAWM